MNIYEIFQFAPNLKPMQKIYDLGSTYKKVDHHYKVFDYNPSKKYQYFVTESGSLYEVSFLPTLELPSVEIMFGVIESDDYINYHKVNTQNISQVVRILNTVLDAIIGFKKQQPEVVLWVFTSKGKSRTGIYRRLANSLAQKLGYAVHQFEDLGENIFIVYEDSPKGKSYLKQKLEQYEYYIRKRPSSTSS